MAYGTLNAGTITPGSGNTLTLSESIALGTVTEGDLSNTAIVYPAGHVIQVVQESLVTETNFGGTTYTLITNFTITPHYSNSLIIVEFTAGGMVSGTPQGIWCKINGTTSGDFYEATAGYSGDAGWVPAPVSIVGFDTPGTVATQTYSLYLKTDAAITAASARVNYAGASATQGLAKIATEVKI